MMKIFFAIGLHSQMQILNDEELNRTLMNPKLRPITAIIKPMKTTYYLHRNDLEGINMRSCSTKFKKVELNNNGH